MGGLDSEFPSPRTPARDRQGLALGGSDAWQFGKIHLHASKWTSINYTEINNSNIIIEVTIIICVRNNNCINNIYHLMLH